MTAHVDSSHGVRLSGGSTGGIVEAVGDDTNVNLTVRAQGAGTLILGSSGQTVQIGGSTSPFQGMIYFQDTAVTLPDIASTDSGRSSAVTTHTITGITTGSVVVANLRDDTNSLSIVLGEVSVSRSTAGQVHCQFIKTDTVAFAATTATITFLAFRF
jgi:hypothetical protein